MPRLSRVGAVVASFDASRMKAAREAVDA